MTLHQVSNDTELLTAIAAAVGGDIIEVASGAYANADVINKSWGSEVIIQAADAANKPVISFTDFKNSQNVAFENIIFDMPDGLAGLPKLVVLDNGQNARFSGCQFDGGNLGDPGNPADGFGAGYGIHCLNGTQGVILEDCEIHTFAIGVLLWGMRDFIMRRCDLHDMKTDGLHVSGLVNADILDNVFHDFRRSPDGTHADLIQFTTFNHTTPTTDVRIKRNFFNQGDAGPVEGVFMRNGAVESQGQGPAMYYRRFEIEDNLVYLNHHHGITLGESAESSARNNTILQSLNNSGDPALNPGLRVTGPDGTNVLSGNVVSSSVATQSSLQPQRADPTAPDFYNDLYVNALADGAITLADLQAVPGSPADGLGSILTRTGGNPPMPDTIDTVTIDNVQWLPANAVGVVQLNAANPLAIEALPNDPDYVGDVLVDHTITDGEGHSDSTTWTHTFNGITPLANPDVTSGQKGVDAIHDVTLNDLADNPA